MRNWHTLAIFPVFLRFNILGWVTSYIYFVILLQPRLHVTLSKAANSWSSNSATYYRRIDSTLQLWSQQDIR